MPVNAGIQVRFGIKFKDRLDSAFAETSATLMSVAMGQQ